VLLFVASMVTLWVTIASTNKRARDDRDAAQDRANADRDAAQDRANADREAARERAEADRDAARSRSVREREAARKLAEVNRADAQACEFNTWRRDAIVKSATDAITAAIEAHDYYPTVPRRLRGAQVGGVAVTSSPASDPFEPIASAAKAIAASGQTLALIGAQCAADECLNMRNAVTDTEIRSLAKTIATGEADQGAHERFEDLRDAINECGNQFARAIGVELRSVHPALAELPYASSPNGGIPEPE
jgi:pyruvate/2-oxoglutarate dehydrogenase complex dihydrolipoamide acyltransferase (E2) component